MSSRTTTPRATPLFWQIFVPNAAILLAAGAILIVTPATVSSPVVLGEAVVIALGLVLMLMLNLTLLRRAVAPLERLAKVMREIDPLRPGDRVSPAADSAEVADLTEIFNAMMERLETERRESAHRMLEAQEEERLRLSRELHDEIGQSITGLMLQISHSAAHAPPDVQGELDETREAARSLSDELRDIVRRLRPEALDDLGLPTALIALTDRLADQTGLRIRRRLAADLPNLGPATELVIYRVAQEGLTNVARHARASEVELSLEQHHGGATLRVVDDGRGLDSSAPASGIRGMRERALLIGARLSITSAPRGGVAVKLDVPAGSP